MDKLIEMDELKKENKKLEQDLYIALNKIDKAIEVLEECNRTDLNEKEKFYINLYQSDKYGYNSNAGISK